MTKFLDFGTRPTSVSDRLQPNHTLADTPEKLSSCSPYPYQYNHPRPILDSIRKRQWKETGLDHQVIQNCIQKNQIPDELSKRIIRCILQAHHLEIVVPPGSKTTSAVDAALMSFVATSSKCDKSQISPETPATVTSPTVLVICLTTEKVRGHCRRCKELGKGVEGIRIDQIHHSVSLSAELDQLRSKDPLSTNRPILITTLARLALLLEHQVISIDRLSILVLDLRDPQSNSLNHHLLAELEPLLNHLKPLVQIVILHNLDAPIPAALSDVLSQKMESSIRANLSSRSPATTPSNPTPSLSSASMSRTPSNSLCNAPYTPPMATWNQNGTNLPFNSDQKKHSN